MRSGFYRLFGFNLYDIKSWSCVVQLLSRPEDPSSLAIFRILFGVLMIIDIPNERGMSAADYEYGTLKEFCIFPLFNVFKAFSAEYMIVLYAIMFTGALGITLGLFYRLSCLLFVVPYWYFFLLDKTTWNNHSYLYGLLGIQMLFYDANRIWSVDAWLRPKIRNSHVPLWNYFVLRAQFFLVYFLAGLKKLDYDWISGYSMENLSSHWIFDPFKFALTEDQIGLFIVHLGGLFIDLFSGFLLFFDKTRLVGTIFTCSFHLMNSQMFSIGMFPYAMLASTTIFYSNNWPKRLLSHFTSYSNEIKSLSSHCIYDKSIIKKEDKTLLQATTQMPTFRHKFHAIAVFIYFALQLFLPYSHFITKGYNNWTNGLYGYSWDMMVHSWHTQHIKVSFLDKQTNKTHFLKPKAWTDRRRWSSHADMINQYSRCIETKLNALNYTQIELYMDIWRSMNHRFNQRQIDPRINLLEAKWSPFEETKWLMPLLTNLSDWRSKMSQIHEEKLKKNQYYDLTFVADFPGLVLENYIAKDIDATLEILHGRVNVEIDKRKNITLDVGNRLKIPSDAYHYVYTISSEASCYYYIYINKTSILFANLSQIFIDRMMPTYEEALENLKIKEPDQAMSNLTYRAYQIVTSGLKNNLFLEKLINKTDVSKEMINRLAKQLKLSNIDLLELKNSIIKAFYESLQEKHTKSTMPVLDKLSRKLNSYLITFRRSFSMVYFALKSIYSGTSFDLLLENEFY